MSAVIEIPSSEAIPEGSSGRVQGSLVDEDGVAIDTSAVTATVATLKNHLGAVINSRNAQSVFSTNGGSWASGGVFTLALTPLDTPIVEVGPEYQRRYLGLTVTHSSGKVLTCEIRFSVRKLGTI
jgi:hypothetical protein